MLSHYRTQEWSSVFEGVQTLSFNGWMAAKGQCIGVCLGILAVATLLSTFTQFYTEEKITPWMGQACESTRFWPDRIHFSWPLVLMASTNITSVPLAQCPKTTFKTMQTPSMGTAERSSDSCLFQRILGGVISQDDVEPKKCLFYFSLIVSDLL